MSTELCITYPEMCVDPHQISHRITTFDASLGNNLYRFLQRFSSNVFIGSLSQMSHAFYKSSFFLSCLTLMYDGDQLIQLLMPWTNVRVLSISFLHNNKKLPCAALKIRIINRRLQNLGIYFSVDLMTNALQCIWNLGWNSCMYLSANVQPHHTHLLLLAPFNG